MTGRLLKTTEIDRIRQAIIDGDTIAATARRFKRNRETVRFYAQDILRELSRAKRDDIVAVWDRTPLSEREELAEVWGYASANSMLVIVWRQRKRLGLPPATDRHPRLTEADKERLRERAQQGLKAERIAEIEGCSIGTVHRNAAGFLCSQRKSAIARAERLIAACESCGLERREDIAARFGLKNKKTLSTRLSAARKLLASEARV